MQLSNLLVQELFLASLFRRKGVNFLYDLHKYKGKLTAEHNMKEAYTKEGFNNWKKAPKAFVDTSNLKYIELQLHMNP